VETIKVPPLEFLVWDVSGQERLRTFWRHYYHGTTGIVFVVDSHDVERLPIAKRELHGILKEEELNDAVLLVIANKTDLPNAVSMDRLSHELDLQSLHGRAMHIQPAVAQKGTGLKEGLVWLAKAMKAHSKQQARLQQSTGSNSGTQANAVQPTSSHPNSQQPAYNYLNPYDAQTANHVGTNSAAQQKQQTVPANSTSTAHTVTRTPSIQSNNTTTPVTVVAVPSTSTASTLLPVVFSSSSSTATPAIALHSSPSAPTQPPVEQQSDMSSATVIHVTQSAVRSSSNQAAADSLPISTADLPLRVNAADASSSAANGE